MPTNKAKYYVPTVSDLEDDIVYCHAFGHSWDVGPVSRLSPVGLEVWTVKLRCTRCTKVRTDMVTPGSYELEYRHYTKVVGYTPEEPADRQRYREEALERRIAKQRGKDAKDIESWGEKPAKKPARRHANVVEFKPPVEEHA